MNITPRYDQKSFKDALKINELTTLISPDKRNGSLWINQDATFSMGYFEAGKEIKYDIKTPGNGVYVFLLEGSLKINDQALNKRDAIGVYNISSITIDTKAESRLLIMDIPML